MELPLELRVAIDEKISEINIEQLQKDASNISLRYRNESGKGNRLLTENSEAISYSIVRMPATYSAIYTALKHTLELYDGELHTMLDVGAGTGAGSWAATSLMDLEKITCVEREDAMISIGKYFTKNADLECLKSATWKKADLVSDEIKEHADLVVCSYVLNELDDAGRMRALEKLWAATNKVLVIIEPGTPVGFNEIKFLRKELITLGASIIAPCPSCKECTIKNDDWCHATCRVSRSRLHKLLKNGDVPYEDEKFSYIAVAKENAEHIGIARVLRHPKIESGRITVKLCTNEGIVDRVITKKDKDTFKLARKLKCGDYLEYKQ